VTAYDAGYRDANRLRRGAPVATGTPEHSEGNRMTHRELLYDAYLKQWRRLVYAAEGFVTLGTQPMDIVAAYRTAHGRDPGDQDIGHGLFAHIEEGTPIDQIWQAPAPPLPDVRHWKGHAFDGRHFPFMALAWTPDQQERLCEQMRAAGHTHLPVPLAYKYQDWSDGQGGKVTPPEGASDVFDYVNNLDLFQERIEWYAERTVHLIPGLFSKPSGAGTGPWNQHDGEAFIERFFGECDPAAAFLGWETPRIPGGWLDGEASHIDTYYRVRERYGKPFYDHFTPGRDAATNSYDPIQWRRDAAEAGLTGTLMQYDYRWRVREMLHHAYDLPAPHGLEPGHCGRNETLGRLGGNDLDWVLFEHRRDPDGHQRIVDAIPTSVVFKAGRGHGYC